MKPKLTDLSEPVVAEVGFEPRQFTSSPGLVTTPQITAPQFNVPVTKSKGRCGLKFLSVNLLQRSEWLTPPEELGFGKERRRGSPGGVSIRTPGSSL